MRLFVTIAERDPQRALEVLRDLPEDHDGVEIRAEWYESYDPRSFRAATAKPIILTHRGRAMERAILQRALEAGIDLVDIEWGSPVEVDRRRVVLSHHDYEGMPDLQRLLDEMRAQGCAHVKIAATPRNLEENRRLLQAAAVPGVSVVGMGEAGLFARILAPFMGSELAFVAPDEERAAAPGQIGLRRALEIYGPDRASLQAEHHFAIAGYPAGHSRSPSIHNPLFRSKGVSAAYTIASFPDFDPIGEALLRGELSGLSVTAPFKERAFHFARAHGAVIEDQALEAKAVNTLVRFPELLAANTDVDGFNAVLARLCGRDRKSVALVGAGGTARAALVSLRRAGMHTILFNRTEEKGRALADEFAVEFRPMESLRSFDGEIIISTLPVALPMSWPLRPGMAFVESGYGHASERVEGVDWYGGLELLQAQAVRQHELFMRVFQ